MPATNTVTERTVSTMRSVKTYLRTNTSKQLLKNLMLLQVHKLGTDSMDHIALATAFAASRHRRDVFEYFSQTDLVRSTNKKQKLTDRPLSQRRRELQACKHHLCM